MPPLAWNAAGSWTAPPAHGPAAPVVAARRCEEAMSRHRGSGGGGRWHAGAGAWRHGRAVAGGLTGVGGKGGGG